MIGNINEPYFAKLVQLNFELNANLTNKNFSIGGHFIAK